MIVTETAVNPSRSWLRNASAGWAARRPGASAVSTESVCTGIRTATGSAYENRGAAFLGVRLKEMRLLQIYQRPLSVKYVNQDNYWITQ